MPESSAAPTGLRSAGAAAGRLLLHREGLVVLAATTVAYLAAGAFLALGHNLLEGDAVSRAGNAYWVLYSRDPHLAAIGFVWNPLPSLAMLPVLLFKGVWPDLARIGFASNIVSAPFMGGMVYQANRFLRESGVPGPARLLLTVLLAAHPLILYHGANGLSEAPTLFFLVFAIRYLARWLRSGELAGLVVAGIALGTAYLVRYEAAVAAAAAFAVVAVVSFARGSPGLRARVATASCDVAIAASPFALTFAYWTAASWIITGQPFAQLTSVYGNSSQLRHFHSGGSATAIHVFTSTGLAAHLLNSAAAQILLRALILQPVLPLGVLVVLLSLLVRRDWATLAAPAILGAPLAFAVAAAAMGSIGPENRYFIWGVPLGFLMLAEAIPRRHAPVPAGPGAAETAAGRASLRRAAAGLGTLGVLLLLLPSLPMTGWLMLDSKLSYGADALRLVLAANGRTDEYTTDRAVAAYVDRLHLGPGTVLVDVFTGFPIVLASRNPRQFVITSDRDFNVVLADPAGWDVRYLLVPRDTPLDALTRTYPTIYATGAGIGTLVREFRSPSDPDVWKLYRVRSGPATPLTAPAPPTPAHRPSPPAAAPAVAPASAPRPVAPASAPRPAAPASAPRPAAPAVPPPAPAPPPPLASPPSRPPPVVNEGQDEGHVREEGVMGLRREEGLTRRRRRGARRGDREIRDD